MKDSDFTINDDGVITAYAGKDTELEIPKTVRKEGKTIRVQAIGEDAFANNNYLQELTLSNVVSVAEGAFSGCKRLTTIRIPSNVEEIGDEAFSGCRNITTVIAPQGDKIDWNPERVFANTSKTPYKAYIFESMFSNVEMPTEEFVNQCVANLIGKYLGVEYNKPKYIDYLAETLTWIVEEVNPDNVPEYIISLFKEMKILTIEDVQDVFLEFNDYDASCYPGSFYNIDNSTIEEMFGYDIFILTTLNDNEQIVLGSNWIDKFPELSNL